MSEKETVTWNEVPDTIWDLVTGEQLSKMLVSMPLFDIKSDRKPMTSEKVADREYRKLVGAKPIPEYRLYDNNGNKTVFGVRIIGPGAEVFGFAMDFKGPNCKVTIGTDSFWMVGPAYERGACLKIHDDSDITHDVVIRGVTDSGGDGIWVYNAFKLDSGVVTAVRESSISRYMKPDELFPKLIRHNLFDEVRKLTDWMENISERNSTWTWPMNDFRVDPDDYKDIISTPVGRR